MCSRPNNLLLLVMTIFISVNTQWQKTLSEDGSLANFQSSLAYDRLSQNPLLLKNDQYIFAGLIDGSYVHRPSSLDYSEVSTAKPIIFLFGTTSLKDRYTSSGRNFNDHAIDRTALTGNKLVKNDRFSISTLKLDRNNLIYGGNGH